MHTGLILAKSISVDNAHHYYAISNTAINLCTFLHKFINFVFEICVWSDGLKISYTPNFLFEKKEKESFQESVLQ